MSAKTLGVWAMNDKGPRTLAFRGSLFKETLASEDPEATSAALR